MSTAEFLLRSAVCGIAGTSLMTAFDFLCSRLLTSKKYVIPVLGTMLTNNTGNRSTSARLQVWITGTISHFLTGILFAAIYIILWNNGFGKPDLLTGITWGFLAGVFGIIVWALYFRFHPQPPDNFEKTFIHEMQWRVLHRTDYGWVFNPQCFLKKNRPVGFH